MRGQIIVEKGSGRRWIYVPEASIQFQHQEGGPLGLLLNAFRTDGWRRTKGGAIPMTDWLEDNHDFKEHVEIPDELVEFAVQSEKDRTEAVEGIAKVLGEVTESIRLKKVPRNSEEVSRDFRAMLAELRKSRNSGKDNKEYRYAEWVKNQLEASGAPQ